MTIEHMKQNVKSFLDTVYTYERQKLQKEKKEALNKTKELMKKFLDEIKKEAEEERKNI
jgi:endo-alpha-1,4-polygalactosaminidase (GH114 family)